VTDGDGGLSSGQWQWRVRPAPGGTDVELSWDVDLTAGSAVMRTLAKADPVARESLAIHMVLSLRGDVVAGRKNPRGPSPLVRGTTWTWRCGTLWLTVLFIATNVPCAPIAAFTATVTRCTSAKSGPSRSAGTSGSVS